MNIKEKLDSGSIMILDGATGTELTRLGVPSNTTFSGFANIEHPQIVQKVHENYIYSGCDIITTNTYGTCRHVLNAIDLDQKTNEINRKAVDIVKQSIKQSKSNKKIFIAGSMSNYFALKENEYIPDPKFVPSFEDEEKNYREQAKILVDSGVDFIILEMLADIKHAKTLLKVAIETGLPVWVGISCCINKYDDKLIGRNFSVEKNPSLITNETLVSEPPRLLPEDNIIALEDIIDSLTSIGGDVYGIMHTWVEDADRGLDALKDAWKGTLMMYPEIGEFNTSTHQTTIKISVDEYSEVCENWVKKGVQVIGGCCGTTNKHITKIVNKLITN